MKRTLLVLILGVLAFFGGRAVYRAMASDETRIGRLLAEEVAAFNAASVLSLMPHFAADYRDVTAGIDQPTLRRGVVWAWQSRRDPDGRFAWQLALPVGAGEVTVDGDAATAVFPLQLLEGRGEAALLVWGLRVQAELQRRDGRWWIVGSRHETITGERPGRR